MVRLVSDYKSISYHLVVRFGLKIIKICLNCDYHEWEGY
jgi:hypothetical protein